MNFLDWLFRRPVPVVVPVPEPVVVKVEPVVQKPRISDEERILQDEQKNIDKVNKTIDKAQDDLYSRRAQLNVREQTLAKLAEEITNHQAHQATLQERAKTAQGAELRDIINEGQKVQRQLDRKIGVYNGEKKSLHDFERIIDGLEMQLGHMEGDAIQRQSQLTNVESAYEGHKLSKSMASSLTSVSFNPEDNKLLVLGEKIKLQVEDSNAELSAVIGIENKAMTFREGIIVQETANA